MTNYLPHEERVKIVRKYAEDYGLTTFIESGTGEAFTLIRVRDLFARCYTVEIDPELHARAVAIFANDPNVQCSLGDSAQWLPDLIESLTEPALFWLDGHFCGGPTKPPIDTPIVTELISCVERAPKGSVILIDDARLFDGGVEHSLEFKDYPSIDWVAVTAIKAGFEFELADDVMRLTPARV